MTGGDDLIEVPEYALGEERIAFGLSAPQLAILVAAGLLVAVLNLLPLWAPLKVLLILAVAGPPAVAAVLTIRGEPAYRWSLRAVRYWRSPKLWRPAVVTPEPEQIASKRSVSGDVEDDRARDAGPMVREVNTSDRPETGEVGSGTDPDALAVVAIASGRVTLFVERDLGTEPTKVLLGKVSRYRALLARAPGVTANLGIVVESPRRARSLLSRLSPAADGSQPHIWLGAAPKLLVDPYSASWENPNGERRSITGLPSDPTPPERVFGRLCLLEPDGLEAFDPGANLTPVLEPFLRRNQG